MKTKIKKRDKKRERVLKKRKLINLKETRL